MPGTLAIVPSAAPITSKSNPRVKALRASFSGDASRPGDLLGIEGEHLIAEALRSHLPLETVFLREGAEPLLARPALAGLLSANILILSPAVFASAVDTASPQGIAATLTLPPPAPEPPPRASEILLVLESLQDPGNLGTLLRTAEAFGVARVLTTPDTANPWNPKAVRASAGSVFRMPILRLPMPQIKAALTQYRCPLYAAVAQRQGALSLLDTFFPPRCAIMIGNEGAGLSSAALALADGRIHIPTAVESLNAAIAGSTLLYEAMRQRLSAQPSR